MGRKRKQVDPGVVTNLPPCRVCGEPGAGLHYGVNTCEACKGFFHRSLKIWTQYKCDKSVHCTIEPGRSKLCQLCRYNRCLAVGMAKEAIKTGRYPSMKRTIDILEVKQLQEKQIVSTEPANRQVPENVTQSGVFPTVVDEHDLDSDSQTGKFSSLCRNTNGLFSSGHVLNVIPELPDDLILCNQQNLEEAPSLKENTFVKAKTDRQTLQKCAANNQLQTKRFSNTSVHRIDSLLSLEKQDLQQHQERQLQQQFLLCSSSLSPFSITSPEDIASQPMPEEAGSMHLISCSSAASKSLSSIMPPRRESAIMLEEAAAISFTLCSSASPESTSAACNIYMESSLQPPLGTTTASPELSLLSPVSMEASPSATHSAVLSLLQKDMQDNPFDSTIDACSFDSGTDFVSEIYSDKDFIIRTLIAADENSLIPLFGEMSDKEIHQQQLEHLEACRLKTEMFGKLPKLPDHEYDYIFVTTGLDTDDRQKVLNNMGDCLEKMIRAMVKFCKAIPGFSRLNISDRIKLIKYSRQEFYIFITYKCVDAEKMILRGFDFQWKCKNELLKVWNATENKVFSETLDGYIKFCHSLQRLKFTYTELVVLRALIVMFPDREKPVSSALAHEIHWQLTLCLIHLLSQRYPNPLHIFARIMDRLTEARTQTESVIVIFKKMKLEKYSHLMYNPLLREMFGGIFFNNDEDDWTDNI